MNLRVHASDVALKERIIDRVGADGSAVVLGDAPVGGLLRLDLADPALLERAWRVDLQGMLAERHRVDVIVVDGTDAFLHERRDLLARNRWFWRRASIIVVEHAADPFGHGVALELAQLVSGEVTVDRAPGSEPFAWIEVPARPTPLRPIERAAAPGILPEGMTPPEPTGLANDWSWIEERVDDSSMPELELSVVIPLFNRRDFLGRTLACLLHQTFPRGRFEVIIADDGSSDQPLEVIDRFSDSLDITYVRQPDEGYRLSEVRNLGIRAATHDHIVLLDCDMAPVPRMLELYAKWLHASIDAVYLGHRRYVDANALHADDLRSTPSAMLGLPDIITGNPLESAAPDSPTVDWRLPIYRETADLRTEPHPFRMVCGGNIAFHRDLFELAGSFDEDFTAWGAEDAEWGFRVWNRGFYIVPVLGACGLHQEPVGGRNETDREAGRQETHPMFVDRCPVPYRKVHDDGVVHRVPLVSIYMPAFNAAGTIVQAVQSVLDQSLTDLEVCIVDDGSTDGTVELLEEVFGAEPRVRWVTQENRGIGAASNAAVRMCRGVFIGQLDADDLLTPNAVRVLVRNLSKDARHGLAYSRFEHIGSGGRRLRAGRHHPEFSREALLHSMIVHPFRLFRARDWWRTSGFDESIRNAVDYDMYLKLSEVTEPVHVDRVLYQYRLTEGSTSVQHAAAQAQNHRRVVDAALTRQGLAADWKLADPDPSAPREIRFVSVAGSDVVDEPRIRVSDRIVIELDSERASAGLEALTHRFPGWGWDAEPNGDGATTRLVGPRLRSGGAERYRSAVEQALVPLGGAVATRPVEAPTLWVAEPTPQVSPPRPLGGGTYAPPADPEARLVLGVTTLGRKEYLEHFLDSFNQTRSDRYHWTVVVADDGSLDDTLRWLREEAEVAAELVVIENKGQTISGQTNSIFNAALATEFDLGFKCDDDIWFLHPGWDTTYLDAVRSSGRGHLVYHKSSYKRPAHRVDDGLLTSAVAAPDCMGCFYTFTRSVLETTGYLDERSFPYRGHAHIDFTMRASRLGHNEIPQLWDAKGGEDFIDLWTGPDYKQTFDWGSSEGRALIDADELERRWAVVHDDQRAHVAERPHTFVRPVSRIRASSGADGLADRLAEHARMHRPGRVESEIDAAFVLNMPGDVDDFAITAEMARRHGLRVQRFPGVVGRDDDVTAEWQAYADQGLTHPLESRIGRKLIASPGAWAYLSGLRNMIEEARRQRLKRIVVLDDDVMLAKDFGRRFPDFLDALPDRWVLALLGYTPSGDARFSPYDDTLLRVDAEFNGSYAFAVDAAAYDLLLQEIDRRIWPFDSGPLRAVAEAFPEDSWAAATPLAIADVSSSNIRGARKHRQFWREMGQRPGRYEDRVFHADGWSDGDDADPATRRVSLFTVAAESPELSRDSALSALDQTNGNVELVVACAPDSLEHAMLIDMARQDPRLVVVVGSWGEAMAAVTGRWAVRIEPGQRMPDDVAQRVANGDVVADVQVASVAAMAECAEVLDDAVELARRLAG